MGNEDKPTIPRLIPGVDLTSLPIGPSEGFVLSRIDGKTNVADIGDMTGLGEPRVQEVVESLIGHGVAEWVANDVGGGRKERKSQVRMPTPSRGVVRTKPPPPGTRRSLYDPLELEEPEVELDLDKRRLILDTFYRLDDMTFYELLGLDIEADKKAIRKSYFGLSKTFHPDTLYGKKLGNFKSKMEAVFKRLTEAYEVLGKKRTRAEYDAYIKLRSRTRAAQESLDRGNRDAEVLEREVNRAASAAVVMPESASEPEPEPEAAPKAQAPPDPDAPIRPARGFPSARGEPPPEVSPSRPMSNEGLKTSRRLMARKLAAATGRRVPGQKPSSSKPPRRTPRPNPNPAEPVTRDDLLKGLARSLKQAASVTGGVDKTQEHLEAAAAAEAEGNLVAAANALRLAVAMSGEREDVQAEYDRVSKALAVSLADSYEQQAKYEERMGHWESAAVSWAKVCEGRPKDAVAYVHAATCLVEAQGDLARAKTYAQRAVELRPDDALSHRALGRVFFEAGMKLNAKRELELVAKLDPGDEMVKNLLRELGK